MGWGDIWKHIPVVNSIGDAAQGNWGDVGLDLLDPTHIGRDVTGYAKQKLFDEPVEQQQAGYQKAIDMLGRQGPAIAQNYRDSAKRAQAFYGPAAEAYNKIYGPGNGRYGQPGQTMQMPVPGAGPAAGGGAGNRGIDPSVLASLTPTAAQAPQQHGTADPASLPHGTPLGVYITGPDGVQKWVPYK